MRGYTPEEAHYELGNGTQYLLDTTQNLVAIALSKIPRYVADWAITNICFISFGKSQKGSCWKLPIESYNKPFLVWLSEEHVREDSNDDVIFTIVHEIAHAKLGHDELRHHPKYSPHKRLKEYEKWQMNYERKESKADMLAKSWLKKGRKKS